MEMFLRSLFKHAIIQAVMIKGLEKQRFGDENRAMWKKLPGFLINNAEKKEVLI